MKITETSPPVKREFTLLVSDYELQEILIAFNYILQRNDFYTNDQRANVLLMMADINEQLNLKTPT